MKDKKEKIRQINFHCTVYTGTTWNDFAESHQLSVPWMLAVTSTPYHEWPRSHQLRTMNERGHTNSVPWMNAVTPTPYHECSRSHQLRTMNDPGHINSVPWMNAVTLTPYHECTQFVDSVPWMHTVCRLRKANFIQTNCKHSWYGVGVTAFIHGTDLMRFGKVALGSTKISIKWLWPVKVTLEVIKRRTIVFCWSCDEGHLTGDKKNFPSLQITNTDRISILSSLDPPTK